MIATDKEMSETTQAEILAHAEASCDQHEIRGIERDKILTWVCGYPSGDEVINDLLIGIGKGFIEIVCWESDEAGPNFCLAPSGIKYVKGMLRRAKPKEDNLNS